MSVITLEATLENGQIKLLEVFPLPEKLKVYVVIPNFEAPASAPTPLLVTRQDQAEPEDPDALARAVAAMTHRTPEEIAAAQARAQQEFQPEHLLPSGASVIEAVFGKWPGTETDEEVYQALEKLS